MNRLERVRQIAVVSCVVAVAGCGPSQDEIDIRLLPGVDVSSVQFSPEVEHAIANAESLSIVSLQPWGWEADNMPLDETIPTGNQTRRWKILGEGQVDEGQVGEVLHAMRAGIALFNNSDPDDPGEIAVPSCFNPRHAIRIQTGAELFEILICFECLQIEVFNNGKRIGGHLTSAVPRAYFEQLVMDTGLPAPEN